MKPKTGRNPFRLQADLLKSLLHQGRRRCRCLCTEDHILKYCSGLALASWIGAISGTVPWALTLLSHAWVVGVYCAIALRRHRCGHRRGEDRLQP